MIIIQRSQYDSSHNHYMVRIINTGLEILLYDQGDNYLKGTSLYNDQNNDRVVFMTAVIIDYYVAIRMQNRSIEPFRPTSMIDLHGSDRLTGH